MARDTIGALAGAAGVGVETVRNYQRRGLLAEPPRPMGEVRRYSDQDVSRLKFSVRPSPPGSRSPRLASCWTSGASDDRVRARELAQARVAALDEKIAELREAREALSGLATACAKQRGGACPIMSAFDR